MFASNLCDSLGPADISDDELRCAHMAEAGACQLRQASAVELVAWDEVAAVGGREGIQSLGQEVWGRTFLQLS